jgi:hypothetical protein
VPVQGNLPIKRVAMKSTRPLTFGGVEDELDVNLSTATRVVIMDFKSPICVGCEAVFGTRTRPTGYKEILRAVSEL